MESHFEYFENWLCSLEVIWQLINPTGSCSTCINTQSTMLLKLTCVLCDCHIQNDLLCLVFISHARIFGKYQITQVCQPFLYSLNLAFCNFCFFFWQLKSLLKGRFQTTDIIKENMIRQLIAILKEHCEVSRRVLWKDTILIGKL